MQNIRWRILSLWAQFLKLWIQFSRIAPHLLLFDFCLWYGIKKRNVSSLLLSLHYLRFTTSLMKIAGCDVAGHGPVGHLLCDGRLQPGEHGLQHCPGVDAPLHLRHRLRGRNIRLEGTRIEGQFQQWVQLHLVLLPIRIRVVTDWSDSDPGWEKYPDPGTGINFRYPGFADPYHWLKDPDSALDAIKNMFVLLSFSAYCILKVHCTYGYPSVLKDKKS